MSMNWQKAHDLQVKYAREVEQGWADGDHYIALAEAETDPKKQAGYYRAATTCRENVARAQGHIRELQGRKVMAAELEGRPPEPRDNETIDANLRAAVEKPAERPGTVIDELLAVAIDEARLCQQREHERGDERGR